MKILSNKEYRDMVESYRDLELSFCELSEEIESLRQERQRLNLTRDEKGVLHRITETKTSRINRKSKAAKESESKAQNEPKPKKFEPKEGEIVSVTIEDGRVGIVYFMGIGRKHYGIDFAGEFSNCFCINEGDIIAPATKSQKALLRKLDPKSEYNLRKMINSKTAEELATEYLGLKVGDGEICGYNDFWMTVGYNIPGERARWAPDRLRADDKVLVTHKFYSYQTEAAKQAILKSLNPR